MEAVGKLEVATVNICALTHLFRACGLIFNYYIYIYYIFHIFFSNFILYLEKSLVKLLTKAQWPAAGAGAGAPVEEPWANRSASRGLKVRRAPARPAGRRLVYIVNKHSRK